MGIGGIWTPDGRLTIKVKGCPDQTFTFVDLAEGWKKKIDAAIAAANEGTDTGTSSVGTTPAAAPTSAPKSRDCGVEKLTSTDPIANHNIIRTSQKKEATKKQNEKQERRMEAMLGRQRQYQNADTPWKGYWQCPHCNMYNTYDKETAICCSCRTSCDGTKVIGIPNLRVTIMRVRCCTRWMKDVYKKATEIQGLINTEEITHVFGDGDWVDTTDSKITEDTALKSYNFYPLALPRGWKRDINPDPLQPRYQDTTTTTQEYQFERPLHLGWERRYDSESQKHYYWNQTTWLETKIRAKASTWDRPILPRGWKEEYDAESKLPYYCHEATGVSTWIWPTEPVRRRLLHRNPLIDRFIRESLRCQTS